MYLQEIEEKIKKGKVDRVMVGGKIMIMYYTQNKGNSSPFHLLLPALSISPLLPPPKFIFILFVLGQLPLNALHTIQGCLERTYRDSK